MKTEENKAGITEAARDTIEAAVFAIEEHLATHHLSAENKALLDDEATGLKLNPEGTGYRLYRDCVGDTIPTVFDDHFLNYALSKEECMELAIFMIARWGDYLLWLTRTSETPGRTEPKTLGEYLFLAAQGPEVKSVE